jgi:aryl-alcohol dehydrogenase-like predicted oxidoreductase
VRTKRLGDGGPEVSVVGLGTNNFGGRSDLEEARAVIGAALDEGVTLLDTADVYGGGASEEYIGRVLDGRRDRVLIATKFGKPMDGAPELPRGSRDYIRWALEGSLRRLRTDVIDVYQMHEPDPGTPLQETLGALDELIVEGKVRFVGSSNYSARQIEAADGVARERGLTRFVSAQNHYSLVERRVEEDVLPAPPPRPPPAAPPPPPPDGSSGARSPTRSCAGWRRCSASRTSEVSRSSRRRSAVLPRCPRWPR